MILERGSRRSVLLALIIMLEDLCIVDSSFIEDYTYDLNFAMILYLEYFLYVKRKNVSKSEIKRAGASTSY